MSIYKQFFPDSPIILLAPMAGLTSLPFRLLNRRKGAQFAFLEMVNVQSLYYVSQRTREIFATDNTDRPLGVQLLGCDPDYIRTSLEKLAHYQFDVLDFNAACPQKKITSKGRGAILLTEPVKLQRLLALTVKYSPVPVTLKMRLGWDNPDHALDIALAAEDAGVQALLIHGRTKQGGFSAPVNYAAIREIKQRVQIEVIGSGDIFSPRSAKRMLDETGCDGVMVARGALGNPWIFQDIKTYLKTGQLCGPPSAEEIFTTMKDLLQGFIDFFGERRGVTKFCKFYIWFTRSYAHVKDLRIAAQDAKTHDEMLALIDSFYTGIESHPIPERNLDPIRFTNY